MKLADIIAESEIKFGTSGARGLASKLTDRVCYAYASAFIQYLENTGDLVHKQRIAIGGDLRQSTDRIISTVAQTIDYLGYTPDYCGKLPSPALAYYGLINRIPTVMVTGSHIPGDRNGIKFTKQAGEILKEDEAKIKAQSINIPEELFDPRGMFVSKLGLPAGHYQGANDYIQRYVDFFGCDCLKGLNIGLYQHSAVGRDLTLDILQKLGAAVAPLGRSESFVPVDTEAIRSEDHKLARSWSLQHKFDAIVSTDGDGDRPLISDENGHWLRGDVAGILCAQFLGADAVVVPVSSNTALEKTGSFQAVYRTRIGSPYVIECMQRAQADGFRLVVGYEANGGFLLGCKLESNNRVLLELPTRDPLIVMIAILALSKHRQVPITSLLQDLPQRHTYSDRLTSFPTERSLSILAEFSSGDDQADKARIQKAFGDSFPEVFSIDRTDGLRIILQSGEIVHFRPSGNAPELRCYTEADTKTRAKAMNEMCLQIMEKWR